MLSWLFIFFSIICNIVGQYSLKKSLTDFTDYKINSLYNLTNLFKGMILQKFFWLGLICFGLTFVFWLLGIKKLPLSTAYPATALSIILVVLMSKITLNESISKLHFWGISFVVLGVLLIAYSSLRS